MLRDELSSEVGTEEKSEELLPLLFDFSVSPSACDGFASESGFEILERGMEMSNKKTNSDLGVLLPFTKVLKRLASQKNPSQLTEEQLHRLFRYTTSSIRIACEGLVTSESISSKTIPYETHKENKQRVDILLEAMKVLWILGKEKTLFKEESVEGKAEAREALYLLEDVLQILEGFFFVFHIILFLSFFFFFFLFFSFLSKTPPFPQVDSQKKSIPFSAFVSSPSLSFSPKKVTKSNEFFVVFPPPHPQTETKKKERK